MNFIFNLVWPHLQKILLHKFFVFVFVFILLLAIVAVKCKRDLWGKAQHKAVKTQLEQKKKKAKVKSQVFEDLQKDAERREKKSLELIKKKPHGDRTELEKLDIKISGLETLQNQKSHTLENTLTPEQKKARKEYLLKRARRLKVTE